MHRQQQRMQAVLRDRFGVKLRMETRELPVYSLTIAKSGSKLKEPEAGGKGPSMMMNPDKGELTGIGANMRMLTNVLSNILKRPVIDETGVDSTFDMKLQWKPDSFVGGPGAPPPAEAPVAVSSRVRPFSRQSRSNWACGWFRKRVRSRFTWWRKPSGPAKISRSFSGRSFAARPRCISPPVP